ncbi:MAG: hypothetical protein KDI71_11410 [Xanthomonadales bacterium]|nr:hypothetical protein [Xanthomonadales bacterium]
MSAALNATIGDWSAEAENGAALQIAIHKGWSRRWSYAGRLADYVAGYFKTELEATAGDHAADAAAFLTYAVNEMVENAVKFGQGEEIQLRALLEGDQLLVSVSSCAPEDIAKRYQSVVEEIAAGDPLMLLMERVERNAAEGPSAGSGLGLLSIMTDYGASLGWRFQQRDEAVAISTMARLKIN